MHGSTERRSSRGAPAGAYRGSVGLALTLVGLVSVAGCADEETTAPPSSSGTGGDGGGGGNACVPGELLLDDGTCLPAGLPPDRLPPGPAEPPPAGVPPEQCGVGFDFDGEGGCVPILPAAPCGPGQMAVPGDTACREIASCGTGTWGDIPTDGSTQYVDAAFSGSSTGSATHPWTTIQQGVDAAAAGAVVAVAAGTYVEDVTVSDKPVRIWGRCPAQVEVSAATAIAAITVTDAPGFELHQLAVTGGSRGLRLSRSGGARLAALWLHDLAGPGLVMDEDGVESQLVGSLVEEAAGLGAVAAAAALLVDGCEIRATQPFTSTGEQGRGVEADAVPSLGGRSTLTVRGSWIHGNRDVGVLAMGSDLTVEATVVSDTAAAPQGEPTGYGVLVTEVDGERGNGTILASVIADNHRHGVVWWGSDGALTATTVQDTQPNPGSGLGYGVSAENGYDPTQRSAVTVSHSTVRDNMSRAVYALSSTLDVRTTLMQRTASNAQHGRNGQGLALGIDSAVSGVSIVTVEDCLIADNHEAGILVSGSEATVRNTIIRDTLPQADGAMAMGITLVGEHDPLQAASVTVESSLVAGNEGVGVYVDGGSLTLDRTIIRDTGPQAADAGFGPGLWVVTLAASATRSSATVSDSLIDQNRMAGAIAQGADLTLDATEIRGTQAIVATQLFGRGIELDSSDGLMATATVQRSLIEDNHETGIFTWGADLTVESTIVRNTLPEPASGRWGAGIALSAGPAGLEPSTGSIRGSVIEDCTTAGLVLSGSTATVTSSRVTDIDPQQSDDKFGRCVAAQEGSTLYLERVEVARCWENGVLVVDSWGSITDSAVREVVPALASGLYGDGISFQPLPSAPPMPIVGSVLRANARTGITTFGGTVQLSDTQFECNPIDLDAEEWGVPGVFNDLGGNQCGCDGEGFACAVRTTGVTPPEPLP